ncbi:putative Leucine--tRNA ligase, chloroplastic/mitochondrial [Cocos nucifera]|uniref:leucine--tRNA ligase n=1 Tax=Cocos nucifera TaxID=13894 RepID=A0A8K0I2T7_COCNU|nr:putative Leucine--tRNA ligase, chloroplastic/mitochondrial [Cocos nucifera]
MRQWMLKITAYADRLLEDLDELDWSESIKEMQQNWIGRSEGAELKFNVVSTQGCEQGVELPVYTTRPDTIFGATYLVLAPEHHLLPSLISEAQHESVEEYRDLAAKKSELERTDLQKEKSGVFSGSYAKNPATGEVIPIWIADYVLGSYGTGAIMAVPAHDSRDHEFALKYIIPIIRVVSPFDESCDLGGPYLGDGVMVNSSNSVSGLNINGLSCKDAASEVINWLERTGYGKKKVNYKLRDWLFARQRYWGEPFPVIYLDDTGEVVPLPENELPLTLPELDDFTPTGTGEPPLAKATSWVKTMDPISGRPAKREMSTMPQWAGSCWYYLRFMDPKNSTALVDRVKERYWGPVDIYVGGAEHSVLHLLYARYYLRFMDPKNSTALVDRVKERYWGPVDIYVGGAEHSVLHLLYASSPSSFQSQVLYDIGIVSTKEPFRCLINQGLILGEVEYVAWRDQEGRLVSADSVSITGNHYQEKIPVDKVTKIGDFYVLKDNPDIRLVARAYKMSKSRGNVINPDDVVSEYGADSLRLYEMFMGPLSSPSSFQSQVLYDIGIVSTKEPFRCLINQGLILGEVEYAAWRDQEGRLVSADSVSITGNHYQEKIPVDKVTKIGDFYVLKDNPDIRLVARAYKMSKSRGNVINPDDVVSEYGADSLRLYEMFMGPLSARHFRFNAFLIIVDQGKQKSVVFRTSEKARSEYVKESTIILPVQINGKTRGTILVNEVCSEDDAFRVASLDKKLSKYLLGKTIRKRIYVPGRILNVILDQEKARSEYVKESTIILPVQINGKTRGTILVNEVCSEDDAFRVASLDKKLSKYLLGKTIRKRIYVPGRILNVILDQEKVKS